MALLACLFAASASASEKPVHPANVYESKPRLRELMSDAVFWANFESSADPVMGEKHGRGGRPLRGAWQTAPGLVGRAFVSEKRSWCSYPAKGNLDLTKPGAISFWLCPQAWTFRQRTGVRNSLLRTNFSRQGYFGINRVAEKWAKGRRVNRDEVFLYADHFPGARNVRIGMGNSLGPEWGNGKWLLFVVNWKGGMFEAALDGGGLKSGDLRAEIKPVDVKEIIAGGCMERTLIDEVMVWRRPLSEGDIEVIMNALHPARQGGR